jgi:peptidoglycan/xylan/chitin deacetylase (PgdA/CDA1 family)
MDRRSFLARAGLLTAGGAAGVGAGLAAEQLLTQEGPTARTARPAGPARYVATATFRTELSAKLIALTIDDGPTREWTPQVLKILRRRDTKATFFRVGKRAQAAPDLVMQTADAGHEQGNHTWAHDDLTRHDETFDRDSLERTQELLARLTGQAPTLCRPPYGRIDSVGLAVCAGLHYGVTLWSHSITGVNARVDVDEALEQASPGSILLLHDGGSEPNATLMKQLDRLTGSMTDAGYTFVTVSELLAASAPEGAGGPASRSELPLDGR